MSSRIRHQGAGMEFSKDREGRITWICRECGQPVEAGAGYLHISESAARRGGQAFDDYMATKKGDKPAPILTLGEMLDAPGDVLWEVHHSRCDPNRDADEYTIGVSDISTVGSFLHWTAQLMGKPWIGATDWADHARRVSADS